MALRFGKLAVRFRLIVESQSVGSEKEEWERRWFLCAGDGTVRRIQSAALRVDVRVSDNMMQMRQAGLVESEGVPKKR